MEGKLGRVRKTFDCWIDTHTHCKTLYNADFKKCVTIIELDKQDVDTESTRYHSKILLHTTDFIL